MAGVQVKQVKLWPLDKLVPYARNARKHSPAQVEKLAARIKQVGFRGVVLVNFKTGELVVGHGRTLAARKAGLTEVPAEDCSDMTPEQQRLHRIADNRLGELSSWDRDVLDAELADLKVLGVDITLTGFEDDDLQKVAASSGVQEVDVTALEDRFWISVRGPLKQQAKALQALQKATKGIEGVEVELGTRDEI